MTTNEYNNTVNKYSDNVYRFILKNLKNEERSQDVVQDSYEKLWVNRKAVVYEKAKSYLFTTAYRTMIDVIRKEKRMSLTSDRQVFESIHEDNYSDVQEVLHEAIKQLSETQRSVIMLRDYEGYSYKEIAEITELTEPQVKVYIYRARVFLKNYIGKIENVV